MKWLCDFLPKRPSDESDKSHKPNPTGAGAGRTGSSGRGGFRSEPTTTGTLEIDASRISPDEKPPARLADIIQALSGEQRELMRAAAIMELLRRGYLIAFDRKTHRFIVQNGADVYKPPVTAPASDDDEGITGARRLVPFGTNIGLQKVERIFLAIDKKFGISNDSTEVSILHADSCAAWNDETFQTYCECQPEVEITWKDKGVSNLVLVAPGAWTIWPNLDHPSN
jgi:hypothetical protein